MTTVGASDLSSPRTRLAKLGFLGLVLLGLIFVIAMWRYASNSPYAYDDTRMYLKLFEDRYLGEDRGFLQRLSYFFSGTNYPHAKFSGRVMAYVQYLTTGSVNFKYLIAAGSAVMVASVVAMRGVFKIGTLPALSLALMLWTPITVNFWLGPITGYPFLIFYAAITLGLLLRGAVFYAIPVAVVAAFTHTPGWAVFLFCVPMFVLPHLRTPKYIAAWVGSALLTFYGYWAIAMEGGLSARRTTMPSADASEGMSKIGCIPEMIAYQGELLAQPMILIFGSYRNFAAETVWHFIIFFAVAAIVLGLLFWRRKSLKPIDLAALCFAGFCVLPSCIAMVVNTDCTGDGFVAPRYVMYALMAWTGILVLVFRLLPRRIGSVIALGLSVMFIFRAVEIYEAAPMVSADKETYFLERITRSVIAEDDDDMQVDRRWLQESQVVSRAITAGYFKPTKLGALVTKSDANVIAEANILPPSDRQPAFLVKQRSDTICYMKVFLSSDVDSVILTSDTHASPIFIDMEPTSLRVSRGYPGVSEINAELEGKNPRVSFGFVTQDLQVCDNDYLAYADGQPLNLKRNTP